MGGANCSVVGCPASKSRNRGLCFVQVPKKGVNDEWRNKLLHIINRCDERFNPDTAHICSRHFDDTCFTTGPTGRRKVIPGSIPARNLPAKSVETRKLPERKPPVPREQPSLPQRVYYFNLGDVRRDMRKLPHQWTVLADKEDMIAFGVVQDCTVTIRVNVLHDLATQVYIMGGMSVPHVCQHLETVRLGDFLSHLTMFNTCTGVTAPELQRFAEIPNGTNHAFYLHITTGFVNGVVKGTTCVRSRGCLGLVQGEVCSECQKIRKKLEQKLEKNKAKETEPLKKNDPLHSVSAERLKRELKESRQREKALGPEIESFKQKLATEKRTNDTVIISNSPVKKAKH
ncbi:hypothetical protein BaRGS_00030595 [Batillaria attramentaria]|uniref:THAP-type domain-containing protein n=1 Tax=Batillaria attramentaria TaxID=370345 RepID=A0ABD0JSN4_9CAEN